MSTITQTAQPKAVPEEPRYPPYRMSIDQYEKLVDSGVFTKRDKLQLVNGILVTKVTKKPPHAVATDRCRDALKLVVPPRWCLRTENPVRLPPDNEPEPDQCVVRGELTDYSDRHPGAEDVGLLVEIADSSLAADRGMSRTYAARGISVYWIVNLRESQIEVYTEPATDGYGAMRAYKAGEDVPVVLDGVEIGQIAVSDILP